MFEILILCTSVRLTLRSLHKYEIAANAVQTISTLKVDDSQTVTYYLCAR